MREFWSLFCLSYAATVSIAIECVFSIMQIRWWLWGQPIATFPTKKLATLLLTSLWRAAAMAECWCRSRGAPPLSSPPSDERRQAPDPPNPRQSGRLPAGWRCHARWMYELSSRWGEAQAGNLSLVCAARSSLALPARPRGTRHLFISWVQSEFISRFHDAESTPFASDHDCGTELSSRPVQRRNNDVSRPRRIVCWRLVSCRYSCDQVLRCVEEIRSKSSEKPVLRIMYLSIEYFDSPDASVSFGIGSILFLLFLVWMLRLSGSFSPNLSICLYGRLIFFYTVAEISVCS